MIWCEDVAPPLRWIGLAQHVSTCFIFLTNKLWISLSELYPELTVQLCMVHRYVIIMSAYSTCCRLHLAAIHEQGKWVEHFQHTLELRED